MSTRVSSTSAYRFGTRGLEVLAVRRSPLGDRGLHHYVAVPPTALLTAIGEDQTGSFNLV